MSLVDSLWRILNRISRIQASEEVTVHGCSVWNMWPLIAKTEKEGAEGFYPNIWGKQNELPQGI